jgi:hypothetical protein
MQFTSSLGTLILHFRNEGGTGRGIGHAWKNEKFVKKKNVVGPQGSYITPLPNTHSLSVLHQVVGTALRRGI